MTTPRPRHAVRTGPLRGFTLVEVLLALGLTMLVLAAAYSGLVLFQNVTVAGRNDAERSQLARALERRIAADIRCVVFREAELEQEEEDSGPAAGMTTMTEGVGAADDAGGMTDGSGSGGGTSLTGSSSGSLSSSGSRSTGSSSSTGSTSEEGTATVLSPQSVGVYGDATTLVLNVAKPRRENATTPTTSSTSTPDAAVPHRSDLRRISYFLATPGAEGLAGTVANTAPADSAAAATGRGTQGLARLDGDRRAVMQADAVGDTGALAAQAVVLAPEVVEVRFRYFDAGTWYEVWDSAAANRLPRAVEVTLLVEVKPEGRLQKVDPLSSPAAALETHRFVVALASADPAAAGTAAGTATTGLGY